MKEFIIYLLYRRARRSKEEIFSNAAMIDALLILILFLLLMVSTTIWVFREFEVDLAPSYDAMGSRGRYIFVMFLVGGLLSILWIWYSRNSKHIKERFYHYHSLPDGIDAKLQRFVFALYIFAALYLVLGTLFIAYH